MHAATTRNFELPCEKIPPFGFGGVGVVAIHLSEPGESSRETAVGLRESEERFRLLVEGVEDYAIFMIDTEGCVSTWNLGARRIKGYEAGEIVGEHYSAFYTGEDVKRGRPEARRHSGAEEISVSLRTDGEVLVAEVSDDGRGFGPGTRPGVGMGSTRERAALIDGELEIDSEPERGTIVRLEVPLAGKPS
jgi:PAS domain S-box-containing protein